MSVRFKGDLKRNWYFWTLSVVRWWERLTASYFSFRSFISPIFSVQILSIQFYLPNFIRPTDFLYVKFHHSDFKLAISSLLCYQSNLKNLFFLLEDQKSIQQEWSTSWTQSQKTFLWNQGEWLGSILQNVCQFFVMMIVMVNVGV